MHASGTVTKERDIRESQEPTDPAPLKLIDGLLPEPEHKLVRNYLHLAGGWKFGWKSRAGKDTFSFWHKHYAGHKKTKGEKEEPYPCADELQKISPLLYAFWMYLQAHVLPGHTLYRCYANGATYGSDGTVHTDSKAPNAWTSIYYPHEAWSPDWAGETVLFNSDKTDIVASIYPKPNRLVIFPGNTPHAARGVSRICPVLRVVLVIKTQIDDPRALQELPAGPGARGRDPP